MKSKMSSLLVFLMGTAVISTTFAGGWENDLDKRYESYICKSLGSNACRKVKSDTYKEKCKGYMYDAYKYSEECDIYGQYCHITYSNGNKYDGECRDSELEGGGVFINKNGQITRGLWKDHGSRVVEFNYDEQTKSGYYSDFPWVDGGVNGRGTTEILGKNGRVLLKYEGEYRNGKRNGKGKTTYADGAVYEENWVDNEQISEKIISPAPKKNSSK
ncbi:hypothetical protein FACS1894152_4980 [Bacilli bacterium]|nr:hypothetical protein FACS1894152_4980 [Bacilli bacterium]